MNLLAASSIDELAGKPLENERGEVGVDKCLLERVLQFDNVETSTLLIQWIDHPRPATPSQVEPEQSIGDHEGQSNSSDAYTTCDRFGHLVRLTR